MRYDENPARDADLSDEDLQLAQDTEAARELDDGGSHSRRVAEPTERGASEDDGGPEDRPDQDEVNRRIFEASGMTPEEARERHIRDRGYDPDLPMVSHVEAFETGYAGQVPDPVPNEAYTVSGQVTGEAAAQDRLAASKGRIRARVPADE